MFLVCVRFFFGGDVFLDASGFSRETQSFVNSFRRRCNFVDEGYPQMYVPMYWVTKNANDSKLLSKHLELDAFILYQVFLSLTFLLKFSLLLI